MEPLKALVHSLIFLSNHWLCIPNILEYPYQLLQWTAQQCRFDAYAHAIKNEPITIYGTGEQTRCFGHVYDAVDAVVKIAFADNTVAKVINIGNNFEISINDLAKKVISETNSKSEIVYVPYEEAYGDGFEDMERRVPNIELIKSLVGWEPQRNLSTMITDIADFLKREHDSQ